MKAVMIGLISASLTRVSSLEPKVFVEVLFPMENFYFSDSKITKSEKKNLVNLEAEL